MRCAKLEESEKRGIGVNMGGKKQFFKVAVNRKTTRVSTEIRYREN